MYHEIPEKLRILIEPVVEDHGLELVDVELARGRAPWRMCITVDTPQADGRVPVERCAEVSREIATQLDAADAVPVGYRLEVSSPGLDRRLSREKDFSASCGHEIRIETRRPLAGRRRFRGRLVAFEAGVVRLDLEGGAVDIPFGEISRARRVYHFTRADFGRGKTRGGERGKEGAACFRIPSADNSGLERA